MPGCVRSLRHSSCSRFFLFVIKATPGFGKEIPSLTVVHSGPFLVCVCQHSRQKCIICDRLCGAWLSNVTCALSHTTQTGFRVLKFFFCVFILKTLKLQHCRVRTGSERLKHECFGGSSMFRLRCEDEPGDYCSAPVTARSCAGLWTG